MAEVAFGDFTFDPVEPTDFRLAVEGASKTGKSNTLAVLLEDLAGADVPMLVLEKLGILTSVRTVDDDLVVVGARDEAGVDLAVPLESLGLVADMVLDRGMKVLLAVNTYADDDPDSHRAHRAVARVVGALDRLAEERLRAGRRRKCLLVVDEVHTFGPERGARHVDGSDEAVKAATAALSNVSTEGGNKGINLVVAYQRRALTSNTILSQVDNYVIHRLHKTDRQDAASEIGVDEADIGALGTGEVFVYGDLTRQQVVGPEQVRHRTSPDPRDGEYDPAEPPEDLRAVLDELADEVAAEQSRREQRQDRIAELEATIERLEAENEDLREQATVADHLREALERVGEGEAVPDEVAADVEGLAAANDDLRAERDALRDEVATLESAVADREDRIERLEAELADLRAVAAERETVADHARAILEAVGADAPGPAAAAADTDADVPALREERDRLRERVAELKDQLAAHRTADEVEDVLDHEAVRDAVDVLADRSSYDESHFWQALRTLANAPEALTADEVLPYMNAAETTTRDVLNTLADGGLLHRDTGGKRHTYALDREVIERRIEIYGQQAGGEADGADRSTGEGSA